MSATKPKKMFHTDDATLLKMAEAEILGEAKRAAIRHSTLGIAGWRSAPKANKLFLTNTLVQTLASNRVLSKKQDRKHQSGSSVKKKIKERKLLQYEGAKTPNYTFKKPNPDKYKSNGSSSLKTSVSQKSKSKVIDNCKEDSEKFNSRKRKSKVNINSNKR